MSLEEDVIRLEEKIDEIHDTCSSLIPRVQRADRELFGNGRPGLAAQIAKVEATQKLALRVLGAIGVAGLGLLSGILLTLL